MVNWVPDSVTDLFRLRDMLLPGLFPYIGHTASLDIQVDLASDSLLIKSFNRYNGKRYSATLVARHEIEQNAWLPFFQERRLKAIEAVQDAPCDQGASEYEEIMDIYHLMENMNDF